MLFGEAVLRASFGPAAHAVNIKKTAIMTMKVRIKVQGSSFKVQGTRYRL
jgi:hypothetical protein